MTPEEELAHAVYACLTLRQILRDPSRLPVPIAFFRSSYGEEGFGTTGGKGAGMGLLENYGPEGYCCGHGSGTGDRKGGSGSGAGHATGSGYSRPDNP